MYLGTVPRAPSFHVFRYLFALTEHSDDPLSVRIDRLTTRLHDHDCCTTIIILLCDFM